MGIAVILNGITLLLSLTLIFFSMDVAKRNRYWWVITVLGGIILCLSVITLRLSAISYLLSI